MAKVKIFLESGEDLRDAEDQILKSINHHSSGDAHKESFNDAAMTDSIDQMETTYRRINQDMMREIFEALDEDYFKAYGN